MALFKASLLFQMGTEPQNASIASIRTSGFSESLFYEGSSDDAQSAILVWARNRARLLPEQSSIVGYRLQQYSIDQNVLVAQVTSTGSIREPGSLRWRTDLPSVAFEMRMESVGKANIRRAFLHNVPDGFVVGGEMNPDNIYRGFMTTYGGFLSNGSWKFPGRNLGNQTNRIVSIVNGVMTVDNAAAYNVNSWVRILRCKNVSGLPLRGTYMVTARNGNELTLAGLPFGTSVSMNGRIRLDQITMCTILRVFYTRAATRKTGAAFFRFRGRRTK